MGLFSRATSFVSRVAGEVQDQIQAVVPSGQDIAGAVITANIAANPALTLIDAATGAGSHYLDQSTAQIIVGTEAVVASGVAAGAAGAAALAPMLGTAPAVGGGVVTGTAGARAGAEGVTELLGQVGQEPLMIDPGYTAPPGDSPGASALSVESTLGNTGGGSMIVSDTQLVAGETGGIPGTSNPTQDRSLGDELLNLFGLARATSNQTQQSDNRPSTFDLGGAVSAALRTLIGWPDQSTQPRTSAPSGLGVLGWVLLGVAVVGGGWLIYRAAK